MITYANKIHVVVSMALNLLRDSRAWGAMEQEAYEMNPYNYYGISYAGSKCERFKFVAIDMYNLSKKMRKADKIYLDKLYRRALRLNEEAKEIAHD